MSLHVLCPSGVEFECKQNPGALKCGKSVPLMLNQKVSTKCLLRWSGHANQQLICAELDGAKRDESST
eukprot:scaffold180115_cov17-Tisochrysis_lutea.AAC.1